MKRILLVLMTIVFAACSSSDDNDIETFDAFVKADINGETMTFNYGPNSVAAAITSTNAGASTIYAFGMGASTDGVSNNSVTTSIAVTLIMDNPDDISAGATFNYPADLLGGSYSYEDESGSTTIDGDETVSATMTITAVDVANEKISGTFSYVTVDENTSVNYTVSNGIFSNIPFYIN